jgi:hypothetical protein
MAHPLKGAPYTVGKRDQQVIESTARIAIDLCNYRQKLPYVIARKTRGHYMGNICWARLRDLSMLGTLPLTDDKAAARAK